MWLLDGQPNPDNRKQVEILPFTLNLYPIRNRTKFIVRTKFKGQLSRKARQG